jgi:hypothetical protein
LRFWRNFSRRGTHVNTLKLGSRGDKKCFGGIQRFYADLRRELEWGNLDLVFFVVVGVVPRGAREEGGLFVHLSELLCSFGVGEGVLGWYCPLL